MGDRSAVNTIRGYFYQFDYSIIKILELENATDSIMIEGIEDVDVSSASEETAIQCKYYEHTEYNHSVIAPAIRLMLDHYKKVVEGNAAPINYRLYGHYKSGQAKLILPIDVDYLKNNFLSYTEKKVLHKWNPVQIPGMFPEQPRAYRYPQLPAQWYPHYKFPDPENYYSNNQTSAPVH